MFSWKKEKKLLKILLLSLFIERVFYSCEDIICRCDSLTDPCSIGTFDNGIILVFEMIVCLNNPPSMKRFQITQFEGYFNIARCNSVWQLLLTLSAYHALNLFEINFFADWLMLISKGWNLFVRLCGTITNSQLFFAHNRFISSLSWPLKVTIIIEERWSSGYPSTFFLVDKYGKIITLNGSSHFPKLD